MRQTQISKPFRGGKLLLAAGCLFFTFFLLLTACFELESEKKAGLISAFAILILALTPQFRRRIRERCSLFFLLVTAYVILAGASTLYGRAPKLGISDFSRLLAAYAVFLAVFTLGRPESVSRWVALLCGSATIVSFLSLDAASWGVFHPLLDWVNSITGGYHIETYGMSANRIIGLFGNSNTLACMAALGIFFALYLLWDARGRRRIAACAALFLNAYAFLMCTSLGATAALGLSSLLLLILLKGRQARLRFGWILLETLVSAGLAVLISIPFFGNENPAGYVVWLAALGGAVLTAALDVFLRDRVTAFFARHLRLLWIALAVLAAAVAVFLAAAFSSPKAVTLTTGQLSKIIYPGDGDCEVSLDLDGDARLRIYSVNDAQLVMREVTLLYDALYEEPVTVEIPEDAVEVGILIFTIDDAPVTIHGISYAGSQRSGDIAPGYHLIPDTILARLQGLPTNHSSRQRLLMMQDGLRMWKTNPVFGRGMGGYENGLMEVQDFHYETSYAHNHYVQCLTELGLVGLLLYVGILVFGFAVVWSLRRREDAQHAFAALLGILLMVIIHGGLEISMSMAEVLLFAFAAFGLMAREANPLFAKPTAIRRAVPAVSAAAAVFGGLFALLLCGNFYAKSLISSGAVTLDQLKTCASIDVFEGNDYRLTYLVNAPALGDEAMPTALEYAGALSRGHSNASGAILAEFYLQQNMLEDAMAASRQYLQVNRSDPDAWNSQFHLYETWFDPFQQGENVVRFAQAETWIPAFLAVYDDFAQLSETQLDHPQLDEQSAAFEAKLRQCVAHGLADQQGLLEIFSAS